MPETSILGKVYFLCVKQQRDSASGKFFFKEDSRSNLGQREKRTGMK